MRTEIQKCRMSLMRKSLRGVPPGNNTQLLDAFENGKYGAGDFGCTFRKSGENFMTDDQNMDGYRVRGCPEWKRMIFRYLYYWGLWSG